jgi:SAM-dependent methyltransferase
MQQRWRRDSHMNADRDAFGHALYDYLHSAGKDVWATVIERDDGVVDVDDPRNYFAEYADWPAHQQQAMAFARGRVLDIGCGGGRHALHLQGKGFDVLGVDQSPLTIEVCKLRTRTYTRDVYHPDELQAGRI